jgi:uncharacterized damage-inducible protein DinB
MTNPIEVWLRGPIPGIPPVLQPAAHALLQVPEDVLPAVADLTAVQLWARPGGAASVGFHLKHLPGSVDRLLTYARGEQLSQAQMACLASERTVHDDRPTLESLTAGLSKGIDSAIEFLRAVPDDALLEPREVGRQKRPSTTLGLIFHAAEHSSRHAGQVVTLSRIVRNWPP